MVYGHYTLRLIYVMVIVTCGTLLTVETDCVGTCPCSTFGCTEHLSCVQEKRD